VFTLNIGNAMFGPAWTQTRRYSNIQDHTLNGYFMAGVECVFQKLKNFTVHPQKTGFNSIFF